MKEALLLKEGKVGVLATDTIYGIVACALNEEAVKRVYTIKHRLPQKPCIILISSLDELVLFDLVLTDEQQKVIAKYWPGPVSIIFPCEQSVPEYLHRGTSTLAFRMPADERLQHFLQESGPLIAPSANKEGFAPATTIAEAKEYFGEDVDFYIDGGERSGTSSTITSLAKDGSTVIVREGKK